MTVAVNLVTLDKHVEVSRTSVNPTLFNIQEYVSFQRTIFVDVIVNLVTLEINAKISDTKYAQKVMQHA